MYLISKYEIPQKFYISLFEAAIDAFKSNAKKMAYKIVIPLISSLQEHTEELNKMKLEYQQHPEMIRELDLEEFYSQMDKNEERLYNLLEIVKPYKEDELFGTFYDVIDNALSVMVCTNIEFGFIESKIIREDKLENES